MIGDLLLKEGKTNQAQIKFTLVARLYSLRGEIVQSIQLMKRTIKTAPMNIGLRRQLIESLLNQHRIDEAINQCIELGNTYYQLAELRETYQAYQDALTLASNHAVDPSIQVDILYKIADIDSQQLRWREAMTSFEEILKIVPDDYHARAKWMELKFRLEQHEAVIMEIEHVVQTLEQNQKQTVAIAFLKELLLERRNDMELRNQLANLYVRDGQIELAVKELDSIAKNYLNDGYNAAAISMLQTILTLQPKNTLMYQQAITKLLAK
jgi:tetratricopeptide (TPR) repeat protein